MTASSAFSAGTSRSTWRVRFTALAVGAFATVALALAGSFSAHPAGAASAPGVVTCPSASCGRPADAPALSSATSASDGRSASPSSAM